MASRAWRSLLREPSTERHIVQVYREPLFLLEAVAGWALPALESGGGVVLLCRPAMAECVLRRLRAEGIGVDALRASGRLAIVSADDALPGIVRPEGVDADAFHAAVRGALRGVRASCGPGREVRAWGELVEVLRAQGNMPAAMRLEALWNEVIADEDIRLLCSYQADENRMADMCAGHSQLILEGDAEPTLVPLHESSYPQRSAGPA